PEGNSGYGGSRERLSPGKAIFSEILAWRLKFGSPRETMRTRKAKTRRMFTTSRTLLQRLRDQHDAAAWDRLVELYTPLLHYWARRMNCRGEEIADLVQEVFVKLLQKLPAFTYVPNAGGFRAWLRTVCRNCWCDYM